MVVAPALHGIEEDTDVAIGGEGRVMVDVGELGDARLETGILVLWWC